MSNRITLEGIYHYKLKSIQLLTSRACHQRQLRMVDHLDVKWGIRSVKWNNSKLLKTRFQCSNSKFIWSKVLIHNLANSQLRNKWCQHLRSRKQLDAWPKEETSCHNWVERRRFDSPLSKKRTNISGLRSCKKILSEWFCTLDYYNK